MLYIAIDGDNIGATVERHVILEDGDALSRYAKSVDEEIARLGDDLKELGATIIFCGGDSVLAEFSSNAEVEVIKQLVARILRVLKLAISLQESAPNRPQDYRKFSAEGF